MNDSHELVKRWRSVSLPWGAVKSDSCRILGRGRDLDLRGGRLVSRPRLGVEFLADDLWLLALERLDGDPARPD